MRRIMGTGSRQVVVAQDRAKIYKDTEDFILRVLDTDPDTKLITGMAEGWDEVIAKIGFRNNIPYWAMIPTKDYGKYYWGRKSLTGHDRTDTFNALVEGATRVTYMSDIYGDPLFWGEGHPGIIPGPNYRVGDGWVHANMLRNTHMVHYCTDAVVYAARTPGTRDAVAKLNAAGKPYLIYPFPLF